ncbi:hypothetical protein EMIHUDRAFT_432533, partial [Emiliania huxleyi CCMP1516]|uniref:Uncharacterized protein n=2 Tax=Emiliania huxleyi TaxID=2903 RepID=A0A0D3ITM3_EMIH1
RPNRPPLRRRVRRRRRRRLGHRRRGLRLPRRGPCQRAGPPITSHISTALAAPRVSGSASLRAPASAPPRATATGRSAPSSSSAGCPTSAAPTEESAGPRSPPTSRAPRASSRPRPACTLSDRSPSQTRPRACSSWRCPPRWPRRPFSSPPPAATCEAAPPSLAGRVGRVCRAGLSSCGPEGEQLAG